MSTLIFLSYRRSDSPDVTRKIHEHLVDAYGREAVFLDEQSLPSGEDIREYIRDTINQCAVVLPVIGATWLDAMIELGLSGGSWAKPKDWVRIEIEEALANVNVKVVPLLIDGVKMPSADMLPEGIQELSYQNGIPIHVSALWEDLRLLVRRLDLLIEGSALELPKTLPSPTDDEQVRQAHYSYEVRYCLESNDGYLDAISHIYLDALRQHLRLTREATRRIQDHAQQPYQRYTATVQQLISHQVNHWEETQTSMISGLDQRSINHLRRLHHHLSLPRWKAKKIEAQMLKDWEEQRPRQAET
jgi:hypothetical protein